VVLLHWGLCRHVVDALKSWQSKQAKKRKKRRGSGQRDGVACSVAEQENKSQIKSVLAQTTAHERGVKYKSHYRMDFRERLKIILLKGDIVPS